MSATWRSLAEMIQQARYPEVLAKLNGILSRNTDLAERALAACFVGDVQLAQGHYGDSRATYANVNHSALGERHWTRPLVGKLRSELMLFDAGAARQTALQILSEACSRYQQYRSQLTSVGMGQSKLVPAKPYLGVEVAARLGRIFFAEGEIAIAKEILSQPLSGGAEPRLVLAEIALREDRYEDAAALAFEALTIGKFRAFTLPGWSLYVVAKYRQGLGDVSAILKLLPQVRPSVRARAVLSMVTDLRLQRNVAWKSLASDWLASDGVKFPIIAAGLREMVLATGRLENEDVVTQQQRAQELKDTAGLARNEYNFALKEQVRSSCLGSTPISWQTALDEAVGIYGERSRFGFMHSLALSYRLGGKSNISLEIFNALGAQSSHGSPVWSKALSAIAKIKHDQGDFEGAAAIQLQIAQNFHVSERFKMYALVAWIRESVHAGKVQTFSSAQSQIETAIRTIPDYKLLLDLARQLTFAPANMANLAEMALRRGMEIGEQAYKAALKPEEASTILFHITRRQADLKKNEEIISRWESMPQQERDRLWTTATDYWQYIALVCNSYRILGNDDSLESLLEGYLEDTSTPDGQLPLLLVPQALYYLQLDRFAEAFGYFEMCARKAASHPQCGYAWYWLAIRSWKAGETETAVGYARQSVAAFGYNNTMLMPRNFERKALCLAAELNLSRISTRFDYTASDLQEGLALVQRDLNKIP